jgi:hypothetical protein
VVTQDGTFNEIYTDQAIPFNNWIHVVFTRSLTTGMHIYLNGEEQAVKVFSGAANPTGIIERQNELYIGHDSVTQIDQLKIANTAYSATLPYWSQWWLWLAIILLGIGGLSSAVFLRKKSR